MRLGIGLSSLGAEAISLKRLEASLLSTVPVPSSRKPSRNFSRNLVLRLGGGSRSSDATLISQGDDNSKGF
jgi:hypothetical protein